MWAINYKQHQQFYNHYGLYLTAHSKTQADANTTVKRIGNREYWNYSIEDQDKIHTKLQQAAARRSNILINPSLYAASINTGSITITTAENVMNKDKMKIKIIGAKILKTKVSETGMRLAAQEIKEQLGDSIDQQLIRDFANMTRKLNKNGSQIPILYLDDEHYLSMIPAYMTQILSSEGCFKHGVTCSFLRVTFDDPYILSTFKRVVRVRDPKDILGKVISPWNTVILNETPFQDSYIAKSLAESRDPYTFLKFGGSELTFTGLYGKIRLLSRIRPEYASTLIGKPFIDDPTTLTQESVNMYKLFSRSSIPAEYTTDGLCQMSKLVHVRPSPKVVPRGVTAAVLQKFINNIADKSMLHVNLVVIANKGSGKTSFFKDWVAKLSEELSIPIGHLSSDAYGRWKYAIDRNNDATDIPSPSYIDASIIDNEEGESVYEYEATALLSDAKINTMSQYIGSSFTVKRNLVEQMNRKYAKHLLSDTEYGERFFYDSVTSSSTTPRVLVIEAHTVSQDAIIGRTNTTIMFNSLNDTMLAVMERNRGGAEQMLLHDTYNMLNAPLHTQAFPFELMWAFE
jgi:hypothetical protein